jgi:peptidoglycan hydrolase FlgJ
MKVVPGVPNQLPAGQAVKQNQAETKGSSAKLEKLCQEFEAVFVHTMLKGMRSTIPADGLLEKGFDSEIMEEMRDLEVSKAVSRQQNLGIAEALYRQLSQQEKSASENSEGQK